MRPEAHGCLSLATRHEATATNLKWTHWRHGCHRRESIQRHESKAQKLRLRAMKLEGIDAR